MLLPRRIEAIEFLSFFLSVGRRADQVLDMLAV